MELRNVLKVTNVVCPLPRLEHPDAISCLPNHDVDNVVVRVLFGREGPHPVQDQATPVWCTEVQPSQRVAEGKRSGS